ncbi:MAG: hypothetical protein AB1441_02745 [Bacillota bacterium]
MFLFSGVFFPLSDLHPGLEAAAWFSPLYHVVALTRSLATGAVGPALLYHALWLLVVSLALVPFAVRLMRRLVIR